jgi:hypothetical protein
MSQGINFTSLQIASSAATSDEFLIRLDNALSGANGFAQITVTNVEKSLGVYSTVRSNSASWATDSTTDAGVRALTANWQSTYTTFSSQSASNASVYSTVQSNSSTWATGAVSAPTSLTYALSITPSLSDGISRKVTMTGNLTLNAITNATDGSLWKCRFTASGADRTITLGANIQTPKGTTFSGIVSSGFTRLLEMNYNGTKWWLVRNQEFAA